MEADCSSSVDRDQEKVLRYSKYSLLFLPVVEIEPATFRWFHSEVLFNQTPYPLHHVLCWTIVFIFIVILITMKMKTIVQIF